jgi:hypothetical protein
MARYGRIIGASILGAAVVGLLWWKSAHPTPATQPRWQSAHPVLSPASRPIAVGPRWDATTTAVPLPPESLRHAEWFLPITSSSFVTDTLHDGQARWVVDHRAVQLTALPLDPVFNLIWASTGQSLAWTTATGVVLWLYHQGHFMMHQLHGATNVGFTARGQALWISHGHVVAPWGTRTYLGQPAQVHPFYDGGRWLALDRQGHLEAENLLTGQVSPIATVHERRWPHLITVIAWGSRSAWLLSRPGPVPAYLCIVHAPSHTGWFRFQSPLKPELGIFHNHLVIEGAVPNQALAIVEHGTLHPLSVTPGYFSASPRGIIWRSAGGFVRLARVTP